MTFDEYQEAAHKTAIYPTEIGLAYVTMGLTGEAGEIANKVKKIYRDGPSGAEHDAVNVSRKMAIVREIGDALWYLSELATVLGASLGDIAEENIGKLSDRQVRGVLGGSGDSR
jgi:NTP pyrophosphatase (non-canonical NTP hydrolase)